MPIHEQRNGSRSVKATRENRRDKKKRVEVDERQVVPGLSGQASVGFKLGHTKDLGNFESLRVDISVHVPCDIDDVDEAFEASEQWVTDRMNETFDKLTED